jgi:cell division protein ZapA
MSDKKSSVKVTIVGEEYTIRSDESPEHTRAVAKYVDETIRGLMNAGVVVESHRATVLAALQITAELFKARQAPREMAERLQAISADVRRMLPPNKRDVGNRESGIGSRRGS